MTIHKNVTTAGTAADLVHASAFLNRQGVAVTGVEIRSAGPLHLTVSGQTEAGPFSDTYRVSEPVTLTYPFAVRAADLRDGMTVCTPGDAEDIFLVRHDESGTHFSTGRFDVHLDSQAILAVPALEAAEQGA